MQDVFSYLERDAFKTISLLKHLQSYPEDRQAFHVREDEREAVLVLLRNAASPYDRDTYPAAEYTAFIASDHLDLTTRLLVHLPHPVGIVFKLGSEADHAAVAQSYDLTCTTSLLSFTDSGAVEPCDVGSLIAVTHAPQLETWSLFEARGYGRDWLMPLLACGNAFVVEICQAGSIVCACFAFQNYGSIWEVGGLSTRLDARRQGHAVRVVRSALAEIQRRGLQPRYVVEESNEASLQLARKIGLHHVLTLTHFLSLAPTGTRGIP
ncbi:GNAT family N-acetyltransferase [Rhizobium oryzicola]|uniref:GNAT family N-acetyltransferase n=1 Tax=Rhizobium oryzicola TaxID=1232668 RepID=A0ABT8SU64_9HYPH|nr:GNAT family N-acetyltransferase [Rhizobium oryzicola]MDO1581984.1 GNAT family N-acetyltransferase [Rhizobium oryzicola]